MLYWSVTLLRLIQLSSGALLFGIPLFSIYGPREAYPLLTRPIWGALVGMALATALTVVFQTSSLTGTPLWAVPFADITWYITETRIGSINGLRLIGLLGYVILIVAVVPSKIRRVIQTLLGGAILGSFALTGHGAENSWYSFSYFIHALMAGVWVGALISLCALLVHAARNNHLIPTTVRGLNAFSRVGMVVVALLVTSGFSNALFALGTFSPATLYRSEYGQIILMKLALFAGMLVLAAANRFTLGPSLERCLEKGNTAEAMRSLRQSIFTETAIAIIVLGFAAHLASTAPPGV